MVQRQALHHVCNEGTVGSGGLARPSARVKRLHILRMLMEHRARTHRPRILATSTWMVSSALEIQMAWDQLER